MADSPSAMDQDPQNPEAQTSQPYGDDFSSELFDDDLSSSAVLLGSFEITADTTGELAGSSNSDEATDPNSTTEEGSTYAEIISHARVRAALKRPIRLCKYHTLPTVLLCLEINLFETASTRHLPRLLRFKAVDVTVEFKSAPDSIASKPSKLGPEVVMFCPELYNGEPTVVTHHKSSAIGASISSSSSLPTGLGVGMHRTSAHNFRSKSACNIVGRTLLLGSSARIVKWEVSEDSALKSGVPKSLRFVMAVTDPEERPFNLKLNFSANLGFGDLQFKVKKEKSSVMATRVDPGALREAARNHVLGEEVGRVWQCVVDEEEVEGVDLERLSNLKGATVGRTHGFR
jgi:hypothetical protein